MVCKWVDPVLQPFLILYVTATENLQKCADETKEAILQMASDAALAVQLPGRGNNVDDVMTLCRPLPNSIFETFFFSQI